MNEMHYKKGPRRITTYNCINDLCEPTSITVDINLLKSTLNNIYQQVGYSPEEWRNSSRGQASISLTHPSTIPESVISKYGEFVAKFRLVGNEDQLKKQNIGTADMFNMDDIVKNSYVNSIAKQITDYHRQRFPQAVDKLARIHSTTLGVDAGHRLHIDHHATVRYHVAIDTNDFCFMGSMNSINSDEIQMVHIPVDGRVWLLDTQTFHTAINISPIWKFDKELTRTHLIFTFCK